MRAHAIPILGILAGVVLAILFCLESAPNPALSRGALVDRVLQIVERSHVREVDGDLLLHDGLDRMLRSLDRNSRYLSPQQVAAFEQDTEGYIVGIGVVVGPAGSEEAGAEADGVPRITLVVDGGPAARAGLRSGERILQAGGTSLRGKRVEDATRLIKGPEGTSVELQIETPAGETRTVVVLRQRVSIPSLGEVVLHRTAGGEPVGVVRLIQFQPHSTEDVQGAVQGLLEAGARSIILDLRGNGGGLLDEAVGVASLFLEESRLIVRTVGRAPAPAGGRNPGVTEEEFRSFGRTSFPSVPLAILIDGNSASASEIVAAALRDHERAPLIGEESFGKWTVQDVISIGRGARDGIVKITTQSFHPPTGDRIHRDEDGLHGLIPDVPVVVDPELRQLHYQWWDRRQLDRINTPLAVHEEPPPSAKPTPGQASPPDPILARAVDLLSRPGDVASLFAPKEAAPEGSAPGGGSER